MHIQLDQPLYYIFTKVFKKNLWSNFVIPLLKKNEKSTSQARAIKFARINTYISKN